MVKDIPPQSSISAIEVKRPEIYFGELSNNYVFVRTRTREFDYPSGEGNVYTRYRGKGGLPLGGRIRTRRPSNPAWLAEDRSIQKTSGPDSRVLLHRNILDRVRTLAPFLQFDSDPYMVVRADGRLAWICDAYSVTDRYPYAEPNARGLNYIRNSVKAVVDAYDGTVTFYLVNRNDPLTLTWERIFPHLFRPLDDMPEDLRNHVRLPD